MLKILFYLVIELKEKKMHVHELNPWRTLIVLIAFALLILVGFLTMKKPVLKYQLDMNESLAILHDTSSYLHPVQLLKTIDDSEKNMVLIDLRSSFNYSQGAILGAENISTIELTKNENIKRLKKLQEQGIAVVFYDETQLQANGPWMLFRQLGFNNIKILLGGYSYFVKLKNGQADPNIDNSYLTGVANYDFSEMELNKPSITTDPNANRSAINITRRKKAAVASGGC